MKNSVIKIILTSFFLLHKQEVSTKECNQFFTENCCLEIPIINLDHFQELDKTHANIQRLYFIRHGESEFNKPNAQGIKITSGKSLNAKLTDLGQEQALDLAKQLSEKIDVNEDILIISSTAFRAQETARLLFEELKKTHVKLERGKSYEGFCELSLGEWEGKPKDQAFEEALEPWENLPQAQKFILHKVEGGESFLMVAQRALKELDKICQKYPNKTIFIISHFHTMNAIALQLSNQIVLLSENSRIGLPFLHFDNCDLLQLEFSKEKSKPITIKHIRNQKSKLLS